MSRMNDEFLAPDTVIRNKKAFLKSTVLAAPYFTGNNITSIISEEWLNYCVRDGNRCTPLSITTKTVPFKQYLV